MHDLENIELRNVQPLRDVGNLDTLIHHCAVQQDPNGMACGLCQSHGWPSLTSLQDCAGSNSTPTVMDLIDICECLPTRQDRDHTARNSSSGRVVPLGGLCPSAAYAGENRDSLSVHRARAPSPRRRASSSKPAHRAGAASLHNLTVLVNNAMRVCASAGYGTCRDARGTLLSMFAFCECRSCSNG